MKSRSTVLRVFVVAAMVFALAIFAAACGGSSSSSSETSATAPESIEEGTEATEEGTEATEEGTEATEEGTESTGLSVSGKSVYRIGCSTAVPYCAKANEVSEELWKNAGAEFTNVIAEFTAPEEAALLNQGLSEEPDLIIYQANAPEGARAPLQKAKQEGIPVILEGGPPAANIEGLETTFVAAETVEAGEIAVENLLEGLEKAGTKSGKIMIVTGIKGAEATIGYQKGISAALAKNPQFEIATEVDGEWEPVKASQATQPLLAKYGSEIVGIISMSGSMAAATADTAEQAGLTVGFESGDTVVSGINCDSTSIESIEQDKMFSTTSQGPVGESEESFNVGSEILAGKEVPLESIPDSPPIFKSNVAKFKSECTY